MYLMVNKIKRKSAYLFLANPSISRAIFIKGYYTKFIKEVIFMLRKLFVVLKISFLEMKLYDLVINFDIMLLYHFYSLLSI